MEALVRQKVVKLADPNADRLRFWDDSAGAEAWLSPGRGLSIVGTSVDVGALHAYDIASPTYGAVSGSTGAAAANVTAINAATSAINSAGGGILYVPPGTWYINALITLYSNTHVFMAPGAVIKAHVAGWSGTKRIFQNTNHTASSLTDSNICIIGGTVDSDGMDGAHHAWYMRYVKNSRVRDVLFIGGGNGTAFLACQDTWTESCEAQSVLNCAFDQWDGIGEATVINCVVRGAAAQGIQFTGTGTSFENRTASNCSAIGNKVFGVRDAGTGAASGIIFNVNDADSANYRGHSMGNHIDDCDVGLVFAGAGGQHTSIGDTLRGVTKLPIFIQTTDSDSPSNCRVLDPHLIDCNHAVGNVALISVAGYNHTIRGIKVTNTSSPAYALIAWFTSAAVNCFFEVVDGTDGSGGRFQDNGTGNRTAYWDSSTSVWITSYTTKMATGGLVVGNATGGSAGNGTINTAGDIYKNGTAFTNPDYVFEHAYRGAIERFADKEGADRYSGRMSLDGLRDYTRRHLRFPGISDDPMGTFGRSDKLLELVEEQALYIMDLHDRVKALEAKGGGHA